MLYLTGWPSGPDFVRGLAGRLGLDFIYACTLAEFRLSAGRCSFVNGEGRTLRLGAGVAAPAAAEAAEVLA